MSEQEIDVDILIIGGGLIGAMLTIALQGSGLRCLMVDSKPFAVKLDSDFDARSLALSPASIHILETLSVWQQVEPYACPIHRIHISEAKRFGTTRLENNTLSPLGYVVEIFRLYQAIQDKLQPEQIMAPCQLISLDDSRQKALLQTRDGKKISVNTKAMVAADGANSFVRQALNLPADIKDYHQAALTANIGLSRDHHNVAYERFTETGPLAMLPMAGKRASLVWSLKPKDAEALFDLSDAQFIQRLQAKFGYRLGRLEKVGERAVFPLRQVRTPQLAHWPVVFIGNAANTLHPVAGQGFNLGLRDVAMLAQILRQSGVNKAAFERYESSRSTDQSSIAWLTNGLIDLFTSKTPGLSYLRGCGLVALDNLPILKRTISRYASGFAGIVPDLACQIPLNNGEPR